MEDLAYIYLAYNQERDRAPQATIPTSTPSTWAAPITYSAQSSTSAQAASTVQEPDVEFEDYSYPSFYL